MSGRVVNSRISVTEETRDALKAFVNGLGLTYEDAMKIFMAKFIEEGEDPYLAGRRLRQDLGIKKSYEKEVSEGEAQ